jgi:pre-rRNA-processing protein TSR3
MSKKSNFTKKERSGHRDVKHLRQFGNEDDDNADNHFDNDEDDDNEVDPPTSAGDEIRSVLGGIKIYMWEFGQNDTKRDSGSKLCRLGYAKRLKIGQTFNGIVLSSEATKVMSPEDAEVISQYGIAGINCSWNRLEEIPFTTLGKPKNQRKLPYLVAANSVNYGKVFKMNTAEAVAAALFISGWVHEAVALMYPFSYGEEFFRLNAEAFERYVTADNEAQVVALGQAFESLRNLQHSEKEQRKADKAALHAAGNVGQYMDESLLPPRPADDDDESDHNTEENEAADVAD